ncbi:MAG TPA: alpha/beta-type small acid-soluble spore protein [Clostridiaceae bacterium]|nr:alpha/beta-type small acid-soluble spore protein [Clostridiaceae bacterium]
MANRRSKTAFENMKYEIASQVGVNLKQGYNGDLKASDAGKIGGNIVKKVFESYTGKNYNNQ